MTINLDTVADFVWGFGQDFLLVVGEKCFVWSCPDYNGDNTIKPYRGERTSNGFCGQDRYYHATRNKGTHRIGDYCGADVRFID